MNGNQRILLEKIAHEVSDTQYSSYSVHQCLLLEKYLPYQVWQGDGILKHHS